MGCESEKPAVDSELFADVEQCGLLSVQIVVLQVVVAAAAAVIAAGYKKLAPVVL